MEPNRILLKEQNFGMGDSFDALGIKSYLTVEGLVERTGSSKRGDGTNEETYHLVENGGKVSIFYNPYFKTLNVRLSPGVLESIADDLQLIGTQSREKMNFKRYGIVGVA